MAKCFFCDLDTLDGHLTCGLASCSEADARAEVHSARRKAIVRRPSVAVAESLARLACGAVNTHMNLRCGLLPDHEGDLHRCGNLTWRRGERPRPADDAALARLGPVAPPGPEERLSQLTQVLLTARSQMLGLGEGLREALADMPRAVDQRAVRGLVGALSHIVKHLDSYAIAPGETEVRAGVRLGADQITAGEFDPPPTARAGSLAVEPRVTWRGSVSDLATDLRPLLGPQQREELARLLLGPFACGKCRETPCACRRGSGTLGPR